MVVLDKNMVVEHVLEYEEFPLVEPDSRGYESTMGLYDVEFLLNTIKVYWGTYTFEVMVKLYYVVEVNGEYSQKSIDTVISNISFERLTIHIGNAPDIRGVIEDECLDYTSVLVDDEGFVSKLNARFISGKKAFDLYKQYNEGGFNMSLHKGQVESMIKDRVYTDFYDGNNQDVFEQGVMTVVGLAENMYFHNRRLKYDHVESDKQAISILKNYAPKVREKVLKKYPEPELGNRNLKEFEEECVFNNMKKLYKEERRMFSLMFPVQEYPSIERSYIYFLDNIVHELPSVVFTNFLMSHDIKMFLVRVEEIYTKGSIDYIEERDFQYFRLMYFFKGDPRAMSVKNLMDVDWDELTKLLLKYILTSERVKAQIPFSKTKAGMFNTFHNWNIAHPDTQVGVEEFSKAHYGTFYYHNNWHPSNKITSSTEEAIAKMMKTQYVKAHAGNGVGVMASNIKKDLVSKGISRFVAGDKVFLFGKRLMVLKDTADGYVFHTMIPYSKVTVKMLNEILKND